ncbi:MAG TPA: HAMP domain-containing sensor histidine kinase [Rhabdaerophilum sp.]|nr:HAMP domain-containing sensor histidine kinase [Rhabdaerophilum sp.]
MNPNIPTATEIERKQLAADHANRKKRGIQRAVKDARERITSTSGLNRAFEQELAREFAQNHISASLALLPYTFVIAGTSLSWTRPTLAMAWLTLGIGALVVQHFISNRFLKAEVRDADLPSWVKRLITSEIAFVTVWALLPIIVGIPQGEGMRLFLLVAVLVIGAVSTVLSHTLPSAVYGAALPLSVVIVLLTFDHQPSERWLLGGLCFTALLLFVGLANRLYSTTLENLKARAEKDDLFAEVEQANARLQEATRQAEQASAAKSRFLATMSHELRTPLNAILGFSEVIKDELFGPVGNEQYKSYIQDIHRSGDHLLQLINEVLDLSRIEAGKHELVEEAIDLASTVEACCQMLEIRAKGRNLKLLTNFTGGMPRLWADERAVRQVALNLLSNAIKFTPQGSEIVVKVGWTASGGQYLSVKDNGPGIPEDEIETVLSTFGRGSQAIKNADQGSGLGLPIVKSLIELHGGAFRLRSKVREGTEAIVMFPPNRVMAAIAPVSETPAGDPLIPAARRNRAA